MTTEDIKNTFHGVVGKQKKPKQRINQNDVLFTRPEAKRRLKAFLKDLVKAIPSLDRAFLGPDKKLSAAETKAKKYYGGDTSYVCDNVRCMSVPTCSNDVDSLKNIVENDAQGLMQKHGILLVSGSDFFEDPKEITFYRALNYRLAVPVTLQDGTQDYQVVEMQCPPKQIIDVYPQTHDFMIKMENVYAKAQHRILTQGEEDYVKWCQLNIQLLNNEAAKSYNKRLKLDLVETYTLNDKKRRQIKAEILYLATKFSPEDMDVTNASRTVLLDQSSESLHRRFGAHDNNGITTFTRTSYRLPPGANPPSERSYPLMIPVGYEIFDYGQGGWVSQLEVDGTTYKASQFVMSHRHEFVATPKKLAALEQELNSAISRHNIDAPQKTDPTRELTRL